MLNNLMSRIWAEFTNPWSYLLWLAVISVVVAVFEKLWATRQEQKQVRPWLWSDFIHLIFNGHVFGLILYGVAFYRVLPHLDAWLNKVGLFDVLYKNSASAWPLWLQALVATVVLDFVQWCVHNALHRSNFLWKIHQVHHSVKDNEMDWIVSFRFSWLEPVIYKSAMFIPMAWFGFRPEALFFHAVFGTFIGHLNHANLSWDYGPLRYLFNTPRMHIWHHDYYGPAKGWNFGIIFSCWDFIFGTAHLPDEPPKKLGYPGVEDMPQDFFSQLTWPLPLGIKALLKEKWLAPSLGILMLGFGYWLSLPPKVDTPMFGENAASSQPTKREATSVRHAANPSAAKEAAKRFGNEAKEAGFAHPEFMVSAKELAEALGDPSLVILDVRAKGGEERFAAGHIPSAQFVTRSDYSGGEIPGVSLRKDALQKMLRARGVNQDSTIILTGDGGPEPHRLWWTLREVAGLDARILDGGLAAWKSLGERLAGGKGVKTKAGDITLAEGSKENLMWKDVAERKAKNTNLVFLDSRSAKEFSGETQNKKAEKAGHIPGAIHMEWTRVLEEVEGVPKMKRPDALRKLFAEVKLDTNAPIMNYCQSGTRSSVVYFSLIQLGVEKNLWNYDGSWAEYTRLELPVER